MFGFPTSVRYLYLKRPWRSYPWPPADVIDRDLAMAVSQFAPMSEVVRDGASTPPVGVAAFEPVGHRRRHPTMDALGIDRTIHLCRSCSFLSDEDLGDIATCPQCGYGPEASPKCRCANRSASGPARPRDFDGNFSWSPRAMAARALADLGSLAPRPALARPPPTQARGGASSSTTTAATSSASRQRAPSGQDWGGYVAVEAVEKGLVSPNGVTGDPFDVALGAVQPTDFLFLGPRRARSRARAAAQLLGRSPAVRCARPHRRSPRRLVLARVPAPQGRCDKARHRAAGARRRDLSRAWRTVSPRRTPSSPTRWRTAPASRPTSAATRSCRRCSTTSSDYLDRLAEDDHASICSASCYKCLRDYGNMSYHALLDWRLARDLLSVLRHGQLAVDTSRLQRTLDAWSHGHNAEPVPNVHCAAEFAHPRLGKHAVIVRHSLEASESAFMSDRLAVAMAQVEVEAPGIEGIVFIDDITLDRDPGRVFRLCEERGVSI